MGFGIVRIFGMFLRSSTFVMKSRTESGRRENCGQLDLLDAVGEFDSPDVAAFPAFFDGAGQVHEFRDPGAPELPGGRTRTRMGLWDRQHIR